MTFQLKDKSGKLVDLSNLDPNLVSVLGHMHDSVVVAANAAVTTTMNNSIGEITEKYDGLIEQVTKLSQNKPAESGAPDDSKPDSEGDTTASPEIRELRKSIKELSEQLSGVVSENEAKSEEAKSLSIATAYVEKHHPNMKGKEQLIKSVAAGKPKDEDAAKELVEQEKQRLAAYQGEDFVEQAFSSSAAQEGGDSAEDDSAEAEKQAKLETLKGQIDDKRKG